MLVKFLSYIASLIGSGRYKPILISIAAVGLSVGSVSAVAGALKNGKLSITSSNTGQTSAGAQDQTQAGAPSLHGIAQKSTKNSTTNPDNTAQSSASANTQTPTSGSASATPGTNQTGRAPDVSLSNNSIALASGSMSDQLTASTTDSSNMSWSITPQDGTPTGLTVMLNPGDGNAANASLHFHADQSVATGTYQFTLSARDASRNLTITKLISVTITAQ